MGTIFTRGAESGARRNVDATATKAWRHRVAWQDQASNEGDPDSFTIRRQYLDPRRTAANWTGHSIAGQTVGTDLDALPGGAKGNERSGMAPGATVRPRVPRRMPAS